MQGVIAAKEEARAFAVADDRFHQALDYVGLDFFPDVFRPIPAEQLIEEVIRTLDRLRGDLDITGYSLFGLRDANSAGVGLYDRFGLLRDDYTPKAAFSTYSKLIAELTH